MKKLIYILFILLLTACRDDLNSPLAEDKGTPMKFEAVVIDAPQSRGQVLDVYDNDITRDFKSGDSFGLFILDGSNNFVTGVTFVILPFSSRVLVVSNSM